MGNALNITMWWNNEQVIADAVSSDECLTKKMIPSERLCDYAGIPKNTPVVRGEVLRIVHTKLRESGYNSRKYHGEDSVVNELIGWSPNAELSHHELNEALMKQFSDRPFTI